MKNIIFGVLTFIAILFIVLLWSQQKEDKAFYDSLLLHQPVEIDQIHSAKVWKENNDEKNLPQEDLKNLIKWFNKYPANQVGESSNTPANSETRAGINFELNSGYEVKIYFLTNDSIYVSRNDVKGGMFISYSFLKESPDLQNYFQEVLNKADDPGNRDQDKNDFTAWNEEKLYDYLNEVLEYTRKINSKTYKTKAEINADYQRYFTSELSGKIVDSLFVETDQGWKVPDGDAGYIFIVPKEDENTNVKIDFDKEFIRLKSTYEIGMYSSIEYLIKYESSPIITEWVIR